MGITGLPEYQIRRNVNEREANRKTGSGSSCGGNACHGAKPQYSVESFLSPLHQIDPLLWTAADGVLRSRTNKSIYGHVICKIPSRWIVPTKLLELSENSRACWPDVFDWKNRMVLQIQAQTRTTAVRFEYWHQKYLNANTFHPNTREDISWVIYKHLSWLLEQGYTDFSTMTEDVLEKYISFCAGTLSPGGVRNTLSYLRKFYDFCR